MKEIHSTPLMIVDQTDSRKLEVYIQSNLPTVQIYNSNSKAFTPNWIEGNGLELKASLFLDSRELEDNATIKWYRNEIKEENELKDAPDDAEDVSTDKKTVVIKTNILEKPAIVTYICQAEYQGITASSRITFARVDTGKDGAKGADGTSVRILGTASAISPVEDTNYWTITYDKGVVEAAAIGDAYVYQGDLYVCAVLNESEENKEDYFINVGNIQGTPAQTITLLGSSQVFRISKEDDTTIITPWAINVIAHLVNIDNDDDIVWQYRYDAKGDWIKIQEKSTDGAIELSGNIAAIVSGDKLPAGVSSVSLKAICEPAKAEDVFTIYKSFDGVDGKHGDSAPIAFLSNEHVSFVADSNGNVNNQTVYTSVIGYDGIVKTKPTIGSLDVANAGLALIGMKVEVDQEATDKLEDEVVLKITVNSKINDNPNNLGSALSNRGDFSIPVTSPAEVALQLNWTKVNTGPEGVGINSVQVEYGVSSDLTQPEGEDNWSQDLPEVPEGSYLWTRTIIDYTDPEKEDTVTYTYAKQGQQGTAGSSVTISSIQYKADASATTAPSTGWSNGVAATSITAPFLWTKTVFSDGNIAYSVSRYGTDGKDGGPGTPGTPASLVDVTPSAMYFKSTTGANGVFDPQYIYLYPRFQNATYSNWQYATDGGTSWKAASGVNGLSIGTYNSVPYTLRIDRNSTLYTNEITSISFRCNSTNVEVYDTVSIAKIYDVVDLQIGGRNLVLKSNVPVTKSEYLVHGYTMSEDWEIGTTYTLTLKGSIGSGQKFGIWANGSSSRVTELIYDTEKGLYASTFTPLHVVTQRAKELNVYNTPSATMGEASIEWIKLEKSNTPSDWSPAPEDLIEEAANVNVMLSNEAHFFEATAGGVPIDTSVTLDVVGYKGSVKSATTVGTISGIPSAGMTATVTNNNTTNTKLTIAVTSALTSDIADYGILTIPITVNGHTINKIFNWTKAKAGDVGASGSDAVTFQVYSNNGYALSTSVPTITLQTFAYVGDVEIKAGATYQWYRHNNTNWVAISGATNDYFNVSRDDVTFSNNYQCKMQFGGAEYVGVVTIEDKNDENKVFASKPYNYFAGDLWIVGTDYTPPSYTVGTMLRAEHTNTGYIDSDWVPATKYDDEIKDLRDTVDSYKQYFSVNSTNGLQIGNSSINNDILTTDTVNAANINADLASLESLDIIGKYSGSTMLQAPVINLGKFSIVIESNGSLSIVANT